MLRHVVRLVLLAAACWSTASAQSGDAISTAIIERLTSSGMSVAEAQALVSKIDVRSIVIDEVKGFVGETGVRVKSVGSWTDLPSKTYRNPLRYGVPSDHDMMVYLPEQADLEVARKTWFQAQDSIRGGVRARLVSAGLTPAEAERVAKETVTIYPPTQLVEDVVDQASAERAFAKLGRAPGTKVEGYWGKGGTTFRQQYELKSGHLFYRNDVTGRVGSGFTDLTHLEEGLGRFTVSNMTEVASQAAAKVDAAVTAGNAPDAVKQLQRLEESLEIAKNKAHLTAGARGNSFITDLLDTVPRKPADEREIQIWIDAMDDWFKDNRSKLRNAVSQTEGEVAMLRTLAESTDPQEVQIIRKAFTSPRWATLRGQAAEFAAASGQAAGTVLREVLHFVVAIEAYGVARTAIDHGANAAAVDAGLRLIRFTNIPAGLLEAALEMAKEEGYGLMTRFQDCEDLMAGIISVKGHQQVFDGYQIPDLARKHTTYQDIRLLLQAQVRKAVDRGFTASTEAQQAAARDVEEGITRGLSRCEPTVLQAWQRERWALASRYLEAKKALEAELNGMMLLAGATVSSSGSGVSAAIRVSPTRDAERLGTHLDAMERALEAYNADRNATIVVRPVYQWTVDGQPRDAGVDTGWLFGRSTVDDALRPAFTLPRDGQRHQVALAYTVTISPSAVVGNIVSYKDGRTYPSSEDAQDMLGPSFTGTYTFRTAVPVDTRTASPTDDDGDPAPALSRIEARVMDRATSLPVSGASLLLEGTGYRKTAGTGADGNAVIDGVPVGSYNITVKADGYTTATRNVFRFEPDTIKRGTVWLTPADRPVRTDAPSLTSRPPSGTSPASTGATTSKQLSFGRDFIPLSATPSPQVFSHEVPGPGTLSVTFTYTPIEHVTLDYGAGRTEASLRWTSPTVKGLVQVGPVVRVKGGVSVSEPASKTVSIATSGPETFVFSVMPEVTMAYQYQGKWVDLNSRTWSTHHHLLAASGTIAITFTPSAPKP